jgi:hypothetical protein
VGCSTSLPGLRASGAVRAPPRSRDCARQTSTGAGGRRGVGSPTDVLGDRPPAPTWASVPTGHASHPEPTPLGRRPRLVAPIDDPDRWPRPTTPVGGPGRRPRLMAPIDDPDRWPRSTTPIGGPDRRPRSVARVDDAGRWPRSPGADFRGRTPDARRQTPERPAGSTCTRHAGQRHTGPRREGLSLVPRRPPPQANPVRLRAWPLPTRRGPLPAKGPDQPPRGSPPPAKDFALDHRTSANRRTSPHRDPVS